MEKKVFLKHKGDIYELSIKQENRTLKLSGFCLKLDGQRVEIAEIKSDILHANNLIIIKDSYGTWFGKVDISGESIWVAAAGKSRQLQIANCQLENYNKGSNIEQSDKIHSPITGKVVKIHKIEGESVKEGDLIVSVEAMKMEFHIKASHDSEIKRVLAKQGELVEQGKLLIELENGK